MAELAMADAAASPATTFVVGDTSFDMGMAVSAGMCGIGAGWGYHDAAELLAAGASAGAGGVHAGQRDRLLEPAAPWGMVVFGRGSSESRRCGFDCCVRRCLA